MNSIAGLRIKASLLEEVFQRVIAFAQEPENMDRVDTYVVTPLLNHLFRKIFPYFILTAVMFLLIFVMMVTILGLLYMHTRGGAGAVAAAVAAAAALD